VFICVHLWFSTASKLNNEMPLIAKRSGRKREPEYPELPLDFPPTPEPAPRQPLLDDLRSFKEFGQETRVLNTSFTGLQGQALEVPTFVNEFWTAKQRQASSLHEVSYRACFKPQLPRFFIERLTRPADMVYDPFMGRGGRTARPHTVR
jgi:hypothetical protein